MALPWKTHSTSSTQLRMTSVTKRASRGPPESNGTYFGRLSRKPVPMQKHWPKSGGSRHRLNERINHTNLGNVARIALTQGQFLGIGTLGQEQCSTADPICPAITRITFFRNAPMAFRGPRTVTRFTG